jgi:hypothetical protein
MTAAPEKPVSEMSDAEFQRALRDRAWRPKPEPTPVFTPAEVALRRKIILNLPPEQLALAIKLKAWSS